MTTKFERQGAILRLVQQQPLSTQAELAEALTASGIDAVQATVSRDIAQLGLVKVRNGDGRLVYALPGAADLRRLDELTSALRRWAGQDRDAGRSSWSRRRAGSLPRSPTRSTRPGCPRSPARSRATTPSSSRARDGSAAARGRRTIAAEPSVSVGSRQRSGSASSGRCRSASASGSRSRAGSTRAARSPGCARTARSRTRSPPTSASTTSPTSTPSPGRRGSYGAEDAVLVDCKERARARGARRARSAARSTSRPRAAATSTRRRSGAPSPARCSCSAMAAHGVEIWGDGSTYKGNDIERFYRYGLLVNENLRIYKPWLDTAFVDELGGRKEMSEWLARARPAGTARCHGREGVLDRREHARRDARGEGSRAARDVDEDRRADHGRRALGSTTSRSSRRR